MSKQKSYDAYIICTSPRSGSTLLCRLLAATGKSGNPDSHFHNPSVSNWIEHYQISPEKFGHDQDLLMAIFRAARNRGTGNTGIFGLRLQRQSFGYFMRKLRFLSTGDAADSDVEHIQKFFGKTLFIHLTRQNKLEQAISLVKATQTGLWHIAPDGTEIERFSVGQEPAYDASTIACHLAELTDMEAHWIAWFADQGLKPLRISYDDLADDPARILINILEHLNVNQEYACGIELPVAKLADEINTRWAKRFLAEQSGHI